jgi:hypothetical protein
MARKSNLERQGTPGRESSISTSAPTRGSSVQGPGQNAKGAPAGANQGGAPRGGSRVEPSHQQRARKTAGRDR